MDRSKTKQARKQINLGIAHGSWENNTFFKKIVKNLGFDITSALLIVASTTMIGVETDYAARNLGVENSTYNTISHVILICFALELLLRILANGWEFFKSEEDRTWNFFDSFMVTAGGVELLFDAFDLGKGSSSVLSGRILRILRIVRITRAMRLGRVMRYARTFRQIAYALQSSVSTFFWAMVMVFLIMYCFAIVMCQASTYHLLVIQDENRLEEVQHEEYLLVLRESYNNVPNSLYSLFLAMTGGKDWDVLCGPIMRISGLYGFIFLAYISIIFFGVLNIVTAIFVDSAMQSQQHYKDLLMQENMDKKQMYTMHLREVFHKIDNNGSGVVTRDEVEYFLTDPSLNLYLESLDIFPNDAQGLFEMLDQNFDGEVDIDEFCDACLRLKGEAKSYDIHRLIYGQQTLKSGLVAIAEHLGLVVDEEELRTSTPASDHQRSSTYTTDSNVGHIGSGTYSNSLDSLRGSMVSQQMSSGASPNQASPYHSGASVEIPTTIITTANDRQPMASARDSERSLVEHIS